MLSKMEAGFANPQQSRLWACRSRELHFHLVGEDLSLPMNPKRTGNMPCSVPGQAQSCGVLQWQEAPDPDTLVGSTSTQGQQAQDSFGFILERSLLKTFLYLITFFKVPSPLGRWTSSLTENPLRDMNTNGGSYIPEHKLIGHCLFLNLWHAFFVFS